MRTFLTALGAVTAFVSFFIAFAFVVAFAIDRWSARRTRRRYERIRADPAPRVRERRPDPSPVYREWFDSTDQLAANLTVVGRALLEQERAR